MSYFDFLMTSVLKMLQMKYLKDYHNNVSEIFLPYYFQSLTFGSEVKLEVY